MNREKIIENIESLKKELIKIEDKSFNVYFFTLDTKGNPSATVRYIYQTAYTLKEMGYNVTMLHHEKEFVGVADWLGEEYASLPHKNIEKSNVEVGAADFLFIPEIYANVMSQTKKLPCKRVALLTNVNYLTEVIPVGVTWGDMGVYDAVVSSNWLDNRVKKYFPTLQTYIVNPAIPEIFCNSNKPRDLMINVIAKDPVDINKTIKPFFWEYPIYKWISFRDLRGLPQDVFADALKDTAISIWFDTDSNFGTSLLESLKCGNICVAKIPEQPADWMLDEKGDFIDGIIWFEDMTTLPQMLASIVRTWLKDKMPEELTNSAERFKDLYTPAQQRSEIENVYVNTLFARRKSDIDETVKRFEADLNKEEKED